MSESWRTSAVQRRLLAVIGSLTVAATGCSGTEALGLGLGKQAVRLQITPGDGSGGTRPDAPIVVRATGGQIKNVTVTSPGEPVDGELSADGTRWQSKWAL